MLDANQLDKNQNENQKLFNNIKIDSQKQIHEQNQIK